MKTTLLPLLLAFASSPALLAQTAGDPVVVIQQTPARAHPLESVTLSAAVSGAPAGTSFTYQWKRGGLALPGATLPFYTIQQCLSRDLGTYECDIVATKGTNTRNLTGAIGFACDYPESVTIVRTAQAVAVIGTAGDDDVQISRQGSEVRVTVAAAGSKEAQEYRIDTFICCGVGSGRITVDLGDGMDFLECEIPAGTSLVSSADLLGGGQPGDTAIMKDLAGFPNPQVTGFETVASGGAVSGLLASSVLSAGSVGNPDDLTPLSRSAITFSLLDGTQGSWSARFVSNTEGRFLGVLPALPQGMATANVTASVNGSTLTWSSLAGGSVITLPAGIGPSGSDLGFGVRPVGPCVLFQGDDTGLLITFDEPETDAYGGELCPNFFDGATFAYDGSDPWVVTGYVNRARSFGGYSKGYSPYGMSAAAPVNPGTSSFSLNCWMQRRDIDDRISGANQIILDHTNSAGTTGWKLGHIRGQLYLAMGEFSLTTYTSPAAFLPKDGAWHLVSCVVDAGSQVTFYINGSPVGSPLPVTGTPNLINPDPFVIGKSFQGSLDEVEFLKNRAISASDVAALWMAGPSGRCLIGSRLKKRALSFGLAMEYTAAMPAEPYIVMSTLSQPFADSDGDGMANRLEYAFGSNPLLAGDAPQPLVSLLPGLPGGAPLRLSLTSRQLATRSSVETISAEFTSDLIHWTPGSLLSTTSQPDGTILQVWGDSESSPGGTQRLGRLKETPVP